MIDYVDRLLRHWAQEMSIHRRDAYLGYGRGWGGTFTEGVKGSAGRLTARGTASRSGPVKTDLGKVAERVNQAVERLPMQLQEVVSVQYLECSSLNREQKALKLGCSVPTMYRNIHKAQEAISNDLPDSYVNFAATYPHCG